MRAGKSLPAECGPFAIRTKNDYALALGPSDKRLEISERGLCKCAGKRTTSQKGTSFVARANRSDKAHLWPRSLPSDAANSRTSVLRAEPSRAELALAWLDSARLGLELSTNCIIIAVKANDEAMLNSSLMQALARPFRCARRSTKHFEASF